MSLSTGSRLGPYEIQSAIGAGGMGEVYKARDTRLDRTVAIKILAASLAADPQFRERFDREARTISQLDHPRICALYDVGEQQGTAYLVMQYLEGETLGDRLTKGALPLDQALQVSIQIADALATAHKAGIVHRDLKPGNIMLTKAGAKLLDFGLAKTGASALGGANLSMLPTTPPITQQGSILGTFQYMAPEQLEGHEADARTDIFAFGAVVYEMLTGKRAFEGKSQASLIGAIMHADPVPISQMQPLTPPALNRIVQTCLAKHPEDRWQSARDLMRELTWAGDPSNRSPKATLTATSDRPIRIAAAVLAVIAMALAFIHLREAPPAAHTLRYTIAAPENSRVHSFAVSPNGRYVTIAAAQGKGQQLWLRALDTLQTQELPGTEDATYPFWSPDSRFIGFFAQGKLKKIAASGGRAQSLCDAVDGRGGSWSSIDGSGEDVIVFSPGRGNPVAIQRVPATGGVPADVSTTKGSYSFPVFLPGGRQFLYLVSEARLLGDIYLGSLDRHENRRVLEGVSQVVFAPSTAGSSTGHLLFVRENTLMAQPFDARSAQTSGDAVPVAEGVSVPAGGPQTPVTVSENSVLVYWSSEGEVVLNEIVWFDRAGKRLGSVGAPGNVRTPSISPDEKTVAYTRRTGSTADLWLWNVVRGTEIRLTSNASNNIGPGWAPQGNRIIFRSDRSGSVGDLYQASASGASQGELLLATPRGKVNPQWTRDGRFIVYSEIGPKGKWDLWVLPVGDDKPAGRKPIPFLQTDFSELQGQISPDGQWMAYSSDETGSREVYVRPFPKAEGQWRISTAGGIQPRWRGDGRELFFVGADGKMNAVTVKPVSGTKPSFEASAPLPLFDAHIVDIPVAFEYDVAADGKRFLVTTNNIAGYAPPLNVVVNWDAALKK